MNILTLTLNPAFDLHCMADKFLTGHENTARILDYCAGGKGINISKLLNVCGVNNLCFAVLGEKNGAKFSEMLTAEGVTLRALTVAGRIRENVTVHTLTGEETRLSFAGFEAPPMLMRQVRSLLADELGGGDVLTLTGTLPKGLDVSEVKDFLADCTARGARIVVDSRSFSLEDLIELKPWLIKPNEEEISHYLGREVTDFSEVTWEAKELHYRGIANTMISLGSRGALLACDDGIFVATPPLIKAVSTIGAGDSTIGGFLAATKMGKPPREALRYAVACGTASCLTEGTRPPRLSDVEIIRGQVRIEQIDA